LAIPCLIAGSFSVIFHNPSCAFLDKYKQIGVVADHWISKLANPYSAFVKHTETNHTKQN
jgi:hypothetical protein